MSEHSKGPELEYDGANGRIFNTAGRILAVVHCDAQPGRLLSEVVRERDALGRKMAAAPDLVEVVLRLLVGVGAQVNGGVHAAYHTEADVQAARAALKKAGVEP